MKQIIYLVTYESLENPSGDFFPLYNIQGEIKTDCAHFLFNIGAKNSYFNCQLSITNKSDTKI